jgi:hypothetical protein
MSFRFNSSNSQQQQSYPHQINAPSMEEFNQVLTHVDFLSRQIGDLNTSVLNQQQELRSISSNLERLQIFNTINRNVSEMFDVKHFQKFLKTDFQRSKLRSSNFTLGSIK